MYFRYLKKLKNHHKIKNEIDSAISVFNSINTHPGEELSVQGYTAGKKRNCLYRGTRQARRGTVCIGVHGGQELFATQEELLLK